MQQLMFTQRSEYCGLGMLATAQHSFVPQQLPQLHSFGLHPSIRAFFHRQAALLSCSQKPKQLDRKHDGPKQIQCHKYNRPSELHDYDACRDLLHRPGERGAGPSVPILVCPRGSGKYWSWKLLAAVGRPAGLASLLRKAQANFREGFFFFPSSPSNHLAFKSPSIPRFPSLLSFPSIPLRSRLVSTFNYCRSHFILILQDAVLAPVSSCRFWVESLSYQEISMANIHVFNCHSYQEPRALQPFCASLPLLRLRATSPQMARCRAQ